MRQNVGTIGLEPMNSEERRFTVSGNCLYATFPKLGKEKMVPWTTPFTIGITLMVKTPGKPPPPSG